MVKSNRRIYLFQMALLGIAIPYADTLKQLRQAFPSCKYNDLYI
nr:hypothetical protein [uncultured bacterium]